MRSYMISTFLLFGAICESGTSQIGENTDLSVFLPLQETLRNRLTDPVDGSFEKEIKILVAKFLVETAVETVINSSSDPLHTKPSTDPPHQQQQQQIVHIEVYGGTPPRSTTERIRRTRPPRTPRTPRTARTRRPQEVSTSAPQIIYVPVPIQQQPPYLPAQPQDSVVNPGVSSRPVQNPPTPILQPQQQPQAPPPVQIVYLQATTPTTLTQRPLTSPRPTPSQEHVYNQVHKILDNVAVGNITGIVDQALGIRAPMPTRNFVNGILNTVFCNPINRLLGRCRG